MQTPKKIYPVRQCGMCHIGKLIYSRFLKAYKCTNQRCMWVEPKADISDKEKDE